ncbi:MAG: hypothetical protein R2781_00815 [Flavobacteriaceae bacterium]
MKKYSLIFIVFVGIFMFYCCGNPAKNSNTLEIRLKVQADKNDRVDLYYTHSKDSVFSEERKMNQTVTAFKEESITFTLPKKNLSSFRIDLSNNPLQEEIRLIACTIVYNGKKVLIDPELLSIFFTINEYLQYDSNTGVFKISSIKGKKDPYITSKPLLIKRIEIDY